MAVFPPYRAYLRILAVLIFNRLEGGGHAVFQRVSIYALLEGYGLVPLIFPRFQQEQYLSKCFSLSCKTPLEDVRVK
ncbi:hypothetical protein BJV78DRAFT_1178358 [Lactifluus subvellereus]|nr:hypothetical protein BJV78DRAFT_1178358 [Lactifluus subvellereus]